MDENRFDVDIDVTDFYEPFVLIITFFLMIIEVEVFNGGFYFIAYFPVTVNFVWVVDQMC